MDLFSEKTIHPQLYKEGFTKIERRKDPSPKVLRSPIYVEFKHNNNIYSKSIYFGEYSKIEPQKYIKALREQKQYIIKQIKKIERLQQKPGKYNKEERLYITDFIDDQINYINTQKITHEEYSAMKKEYRMLISKMLYEGNKPFEILEKIKSIYNVSKV